MSQVTTITLHLSCSDDKGAAKINDWLVGGGRHGGFARVEDHYAGRKHAEAHVYGLACNYLFEEEEAKLIRLFRETDWLYPEYAVLIVKPQELAAKVFRPQSYD